MTYLVYPPLGGGSSGSDGGSGGGTTPTFPLIAPTPGAAGSEPFRFATGGGLHGTSSGGISLSTASADALLVDPQGNINLPFALTGQGLATLAGGVSTTSLTAASASVSGNASIGGNLGVAGSLQLTGDLSARKVTATSDLSAASISTQGNIAGTSLTITGAATLGSLNVGGTFHASQIASDGPLYFPTSPPNAPGLALVDQTSTGVFGAQDTLGFAVAGQTALSIDDGLTATFAGNMTANGGTFDQVIVQSALGCQGGAYLQDITANNAEFSGIVSCDDNVHVGGSLTINHDLSAQGVTRLANLAIDQLSTDHNLSVGGNAEVHGSTTLDGDASVAGALSANSLATGYVQLLTVRQPGSSAQNPYVDSDTSPGGQTIPFTALLGPEGVLKVAGNFTSLGAGSFGGGVSMAALTATTGTFSGAGSFGGALTAPSLALAGALTAAKSTIAGSTFQTGSGSPNGQVSGSVGDQYIDSTTGLAYLKMSGSQTQSGWVAVTTQATGTAFPLLAPTSGDTSTPEFAFADEARSGLGRTSSLPLFLSVAGNVALKFAADGSVEVPANFKADGSAQFASLTAQNTSAGTLTAGTSTLGALTASSGQFGGLLAAQGGLQVTGAATISSTLAAGPSTLASLLVTGQSHLQGAVALDGALTAQGPVAAPRAVVGGSALSAGSGNPNGSVSGSPADGFFAQDTGLWWIKGSGQATSAGWVSVATSASGLAFPLQAPLSGNLTAPSYGFTTAGMGITDQGVNVLVGVSGGQVGWKLDASRNFSLSAGLTVAASTALQGLTAAATTVSSLSTGALTATGATSLAGLTAAAASVTQLTTTTGGVSSAAGVSAQGLVAGATVAAGGSTWRAGSGAPASGVGQAGDIYTRTDANPPLYARDSSGWRAAALVGDAAPSQFPLRGPADSASAPDFSWSASPATGMYSPGTNKIGWSTGGTSAGTVDASQNWALVGTLSAAAATFTGLTVNGTASVTGAASLGSTLQVAGAVTLTTSLNAASVTASGALTAGSATINGLLGAQSLSVTGDATIGGNLTVSGTTTYNGVNRAGYYQVGDGTVSAPAYAFTSETGLGVWRPAAATLGFAAGGANLATLTASLATFAGALRVGGNNAGLTSTAANTVQLQTAGAAALSIDASQNATFAAKLTATGLATLSAGLASTTAAFSTSVTSPLALFTETTAPSTAATGQLFVKSTDHNLYFLTSTGTTYQVTPAQPAYPLVGPAGSQTAPTYAVGVSSSGLYGYNTTSTTYLPSITQNGVAAAWFLSTTLGGSAAYGMVLGDPANRLTAGGGLVAGSVAPGGGIYAAPPGQLYQHLGGGAAASLYVAEHTSGLSSAAWAKVLTTSSTITPTYPLVGPAGSPTACTFAAGAANTGLYTYNFGTNNNTAVLANNGGAVAWFFQTTLGSQPAFGMTLGNPVNNATVGGGMYAGSVAPTGGIYAGTPAQLYQHMGGGVGASLYVAEQTSGQSSAAWAKVLTTGSQLASANFAQTTAPTGVASVTKLYSDTSGLLRVVNGTFTPTSPPVVRQDVLASSLAASQTLTVANNGATLVASAATQYTVTLPASVAGYDLCYRFQVENSAGVVIKGNTSQVIQYGTSASTSAGTLTSTAVGSTVELFLRAGATTWYTRCSMGTWATA